jgi:hypothetical protein
MTPDKFGPRVKSVVAKYIYEICSNLLFMGGEANQ